MPIAAKPSQPPTWTRILSLISGPFFMWLWTYGLIQATGLSFPLMFFLVVLGAALIMIVLVVFGLKALEAKESLWRFNLSSIMLVMAPICVYLAALRVVLAKAPLQEFGWVEWLVVCAGSFVIMTVSTLLLLVYAEALVWLALKVLRAFSPRARLAAEPSSTPLAAENAPVSSENSPPSLDSTEDRS